MLHMPRFLEKSAIVTGGANGIGRAALTELCKEGCAVTFADMSKRGCDVQDQLTDGGYHAQFVHGDMADEAFCRLVVDEAVSKWGRLHYLVNNAFSFLSKAMDATHEDWDRMIHVGPAAFAGTAAAAAPHMKAAGGGAIVNVSSVSAKIAQPLRWTYNAGKGAIQNLTRCQALDLAPLGIRVNSVSPGWIWTSEVKKAADGDRDKWEPVWGKYHMLRRLGEPVEVARAILFLLSDDASFVTGADLTVDGGYSGLGPEGLGEASRFAGSD